MTYTRRVLVAVVSIVLTLSVVAMPVFGAVPSQVQQADGETVTVTCNGQSLEVPLSDVKAGYNSNTDVVPDMLQSAVMSNTTELRVDGLQADSFIVETGSDGDIQTLTTGSVDEPDVIVETDKETVCGTLASENPAQSFQSAYEDGDIDIRATNTVDKAKVFVVETIVEATSFVKNI